MTEEKMLLLRSLMAASSCPDPGKTRTRLSNSTYPKVIEETLPFEPSDRSWTLDAACRGMDTNLFFPDRGTSKKTINAVKQICNQCVVNEQCLDYAIETNQRIGFWGGKSDKERRAIVRYRKINNHVS